MMDIGHSLGSYQRFSRIGGPVLPTSAHVAVHARCKFLAMYLEQETGRHCRHPRLRKELGVLQAIVLRMAVCIMKNGRIDETINRKDAEEDKVVRKAEHWYASRMAETRATVYGARKRST